MAAVTVSAPLAAHAQTIGGSINGPGLFARDRNVAVRERARPEYAASGIQFGGLWAFPKVEGDVEYNDNIFAVAKAKTHDTIFRVKPELVVQSNWNRHMIDAYGRASINRYASRTSEDTTDWDVGADGRLDIVRGADVKAGAEASRLTEPRSSSSSPTNAAAPGQYIVGAAYLSGEREVNRIKLAVRGDWHNYNYLSVPAVGGGTINEDSRDRTVYALAGRADYALSPDTALFVEVDGNWRDYRLPGTILTPARNSKGYQALVGANFDITALVRGEIGVGYIHQSYTSPAYNDTGGFGLRAKLEWFPTQLTTVTLTGTRTVEDAAIQGSGGYLSTNVGAQVDHELLRNVILTANAGYGVDSYNGVARTDKRYNAGLSATYLLNRRVGVNLGYSYFKQDSTGVLAGANFLINRVMAGLVLQY